MQLFYVRSGEFYLYPSKRIKFYVIDGYMTNFIFKNRNSTLNESNDRFTNIEHEYNNKYKLTNYAIIRNLNGFWINEDDSPVLNSLRNLLFIHCYQETIKIL